MTADRRDRSPTATDGNHLQRNTNPDAAGGERLRRVETPVHSNSLKTLYKYLTKNRSFPTRILHLLFVNPNIDERLSWFVVERMHQC